MISTPQLRRPAIVSPAADKAFKELLRRTFAESVPWEDQYLEHEMAHFAHVLRAGLCPTAGSVMLEFGCNIGATSIVLAHAGAAVVACDVSTAYLALAQLNANRYGVLNAVRLLQIAETGALPFKDGAFDAVICNSVLEYVQPTQLQNTLRELDRVLAPGGHLVIWGTSNRLWPVEAHSRRWLANYVPRAFDRFLRKPLQRGLWPWELQRARSSYDDVLHQLEPAQYLEARGVSQAGGLRELALTVGSSLCRMLGVHADFVTPWLVAVCRKRQP